MADIRCRPWGMFQCGTSCGTSDVPHVLFKRRSGFWTGPSPSGRGFIAGTDDVLGALELSDGGAGEGAKVSRVVPCFEVAFPDKVALEQYDLVPFIAIVE